MTRSPRRPEWVTIGRVTAPHGLAGAVRVLPLTDVEGRFERLQEAYLLPSGSTARRRVTVQRVAYKGNLVLVWFRELRNVDEAEALRNALVQVPGESLPPLPEDTYYVVDLIGSRVECVDGRPLGTLVDVLQTGGANDVYVVRPDEPGAKREILLPAIRQVVKEVDVENGRIVVDPWPGMLDD